MTELSYQALSPVAFLERAAHCHTDHLAVVDDDLRLSYGQLHERCQRLAGALVDLAGERPVAVLAPNTHVLLEAHFGVPWAGAPLVAINTRLSADEVAYILGHSAASVLVYDADLEDTARAAAAKAGDGLRLLRSGGPDDEYEQALATAEPFAKTPTDERALLSLNYTSGTTGRPKGVMYHHRGAYLQALAMALHTGLDMSSVHLWTLPMFHCNGWCFPWAVTAAAARHVCLRKFDADQVWRIIERESVTHLEGAPTVLTMLAASPEADRPRSGPRVHICTGGAPPSPTILERMASVGADVTHLYGLTETFGPSVVCQWRPDWNELGMAEQARLKARQGVGNVISQQVRVVAEDGGDVPADGTTIGQIALRGNNVMLGYYKDPEATAAAAPDGWFRTGDLGVMHPDGYIELRDRMKDVIISGGENIASVEVEQALVTHPAVLEAAVVAVPDQKWGEVPVAYVTLREGVTATEAEIIAHVRERLARFKAPKRVVFADLPKTSTGKIQKFVLREWARAAQAAGEQAEPAVQQRG